MRIGEQSRHAGAVWMRLVIDVYHKCVWRKPEPEEIWGYRQLVQVMKFLAK